MDTLHQVRFVWKPLVFVACLVPVLVIAIDIRAGSLGANPIETIQDHFGIWGLRFIVITLSVTPLRQLTAWNWLQRFRRMLGLFAFFYVMLHFLTWLVLDSDLNFTAIAEDITERPFITLGFSALLILAAMAATSPLAIRRRMGRNWQKLHNAFYGAAILGVWHYWWQVKLDTSDPAIYAVAVALLLGYRLRQRSARGC